MHFTIIPPRGKEIVVPKAAKSKMVKGDDLLMFLCNELEINGYQDYFGLLYCDKRNGKMSFLDRNDILKKLEITAGKKITLHLVTTFHPEHPEETFRSAPSRRLFCNLMKDKLVSGELGCDVDTHAYLDGIYLQATIGDYKGETIGRSYADDIRCCDIYTPTYLNCGSTPKESVYIRKVRNYHKKNIGIDQAVAEKLYLSKIKMLPAYPYRLYRNVRTNGHNVCLGLTVKGLYLIEEGELEQFHQPNITAEYQWSEIHSCTKKKHKLHIGLASQSEMSEIVFKVKGSEVDRLANDISILRDGLITRDGVLQRKPLEETGALCGKVARKTFKLGLSRKISDFTLSVEKSFEILRERTLTGSSISDFQR